MGKNGTCTLGETSFTRSVSPGAFQLSLMAEGGAIVFYPVNAGIRWQSRFCLARKRNNITTTINQIRSVSCSLLLSSSVTLCSEGFSFTLFSVRMSPPCLLLSCRRELEGLSTSHRALSVSSMTSSNTSFLLPLLSEFSRLILEKHL